MSARGLELHLDDVADAHLGLLVHEVLGLGVGRAAAIGRQQRVRLHRPLRHRHVLAIELHRDVSRRVRLGGADGEHRVCAVGRDGVLFAVANLKSKNRSRAKKF